MNLITAISPLNKLFALVGLFPMETTIDGNLQITNKGIFKSLLVFIIVAVTGIVTFYTPNHKNISNGSIIADLVRVVIYCAIIVVSAVTILMEVIYRERIYQIIINIQDVDTFISKNIDVFRIKIDYNSLRTKALLVVALFICCHAVVILQDFVMIPGDFVDKDFLSVARIFFLYYVTFSILSLMVLKFTCLCFLIKQRIFWINELLDNSTDLEEIQLLTDSSHDNTDKVISLIFELHCKLFKIAKELNASYSVQITLFVTQIFLVLTKQCFYTVLLIMNANSFFPTMDILSRTIWSSYQMFLLLLLAITCYKTSKEGTRTGEILHTIIHRRKGINMSDNTKKMLQLYSLQILHCSPRFSAAGFFSIDMALIKSVIASITTYLVILIQFNLSQERN